ncbi:MAG: methyltransferase domain-containing protein [Nanoarchaeota archaeon]
MNFVKIFTKRIRAYKARRFIEDIQNKRLLDIGCNDKFFMNSFTSLETAGIDKIYGQNVENGLDYQGDYFDYVTMLAVIEHLDNDNKVIKECYRVLRKNGFLIITTPFEKAEKFMKLYTIKSLEHKRYFTKKDFEDLDGFELVHYSKFEFGLNQLIVLKRI